MNLTNTEITVLKDFLDQLADHFSNAGCNDYDLPNTPENKQLLLDATIYDYTVNGFANDADEMNEMNDDIKRINNAKGKKLYITDSLLLSYLKYKLSGDK